MRIRVEWDGQQTHLRCYSNNKKDKYCYGHTTLPLPPQSIPREDLRKLFAVMEAEVKQEYINVNVGKGYTSNGETS